MRKFKAAKGRENPASPILVGKRKSMADKTLLIVGLGNPGEKYEFTRHNAGFMMLDSIAARLNVKVKKLKFRAMYTQVRMDGIPVVLLKPLTYMNRSGEAVREAASFFKLPPERIIVISDDVSMPVGKMRIRTRGSAGGHNGLKSIISHVGEEFLRVRMGVGSKPEEYRDMADWVLGHFSPEDRKLLDGKAGDVFDAIQMMVHGETDKAMNRYN